MTIKSVAGAVLVVSLLATVAACSKTDPAPVTPLPAACVDLAATVEAVRWAPGGSTAIISGSDDSGPRLWRLDASSLALEDETPDSPFNPFVIDAVDDQSAIVASDRGEIARLQGGTFTRLGEIQNATGIALSGSHIYVVEPNDPERSTVDQYEADTGDHVSTVGTFDGNVEISPGASRDTIVISVTPYPEVERNGTTDFIAVTGSGSTRVSLPVGMFGKSPSLDPSNTFIVFVEGETGELLRIGLRDAAIDKVGGQADLVQVSALGALLIVRHELGPSDAVCVAGP